MKIFDKIILIIFSYIILILAIVLILMTTGVVEIDTINEGIKTLIEGQTSSRVILSISILFVLIAIKCIFFDKTSKKQINETQGVLLENEAGKLLISKETLENLVNSVAMNFESAEDVTTRISLDKENQVKIFINLVVNSDVVIKELSVNLQNKIKEKIKTATDLEVKEVNINVKKVVQKKKTIEEL